MESLHHNWIRVLVHLLTMFPNIFHLVYWMIRREELESVLHRLDKTMSSRVRLFMQCFEFNHEMARTMSIPPNISPLSDLIFTIEFDFVVKLSTKESDSVDRLNSRWVTFLRIFQRSELGPWILHCWNSVGERWLYVGSVNKTCWRLDGDAIASILTPCLIARIRVYNVHRFDRPNSGQ